ncbi:MAG: hypothetical protein KC502_14655 [Myxococcales bacterium]|nr:hypothetical protein [Myxococcales bacterium]
MKFDRKNSSPTQSDSQPEQSRSGERGQINDALRGRNYDEQANMLRPDGHRPATEERGEAEPGNKPKTAQVILSARKGGSPFSREFWQDLNVGHCWVDVVKPDGRKDSWGYTANNVRDFPRYQPWKSVEGRVLNPDGSRGATGTLNTAIDEDQLARGEAWARSAGNSYNLFGFGGGHSCATFAKGFYEEATGDSAPTGMFGALIANPNDLSTAMNKRAEQDAEKDGEQDGGGE